MKAEEKNRISRGDAEKAEGENRKESTVSSPISPPRSPRLRVNKTPGGAQSYGKGENGDADRFNASEAVQSSRHTPCAVIFTSLLAFIYAHSWLKWFLPFQLFAFIRG